MRYDIPLPFGPASKDFEALPAMALKSLMVRAVHPVETLGQAVYHESEVM